MITFHGWRTAFTIDGMACHGTWSSLVRYKTGTVKLWPWHVTARCDGLAFRKNLKDSREAALNLLRFKLRQAIGEAASMIMQVNERMLIVTRRRNGRQRGRIIEHISWMHDRELSHIDVHLTTGRPC